MARSWWWWMFLLCAQMVMNAQRLQLSPAENAFRPERSVDGVQTWWVQTKPLEKEMAAPAAMCIKGKNVTRGISCSRMTCLFKCVTIAEDILSLDKRFCGESQNLFLRSSNATNVWNVLSFQLTFIPLVDCYPEFLVSFHWDLILRNGSESVSYAIMSAHSMLLRFWQTGRENLDLHRPHERNQEA